MACFIVLLQKFSLGNYSLQVVISFLERWESLYRDQATKCEPIRKVFAVQELNPKFELPRWTVMPLCIASAKCFKGVTTTFSIFLMTS